MKPVRHLALLAATSLLAACQTKSAPVRPSANPVPVSANQHKTATDLAVERKIRSMVKNGTWMPGTGYHGGEIIYSSGDGVKSFVP